MVYIAVPIKVKNLDQALVDIKKAIAKRPDLLELRLDYMPDLDELALDIILDSCSLDAIVTIRHKEESGPDPEAGFNGSETRRRELYQHAIGRGVAYIDIEALRCNEMDKQNTKLIVSCHDFEKTPQSLNVRYQTIKCNIPNADVIKFAVKANSRDDYRRVLDLIEQANKDNVPIIGIAMGEEGAKSRIHPGNHVTYACLEKGKGTAVGQYTVAEMRELLGE
jgi:3-dehydroquinate dehydratase-1